MISRGNREWGVKLGIRLSYVVCIVNHSIGTGDLGRTESCSNPPEDLVPDPRRPAGIDTQA